MTLSTYTYIERFISSCKIIRKSKKMVEFKYIIIVIIFNIKNKYITEDIN